MNEALLSKWISTAALKRMRIAFPEATEEKILRAARDAMEKDAIDAVLVGDPEAVRAAADGYGVPLEGMELISSTDAAAVEEKAGAYVLRNSALSVKSAIRKCRDPMYYAFILEALDEVDGVFCGLSHTTGDVILAASTIVGLKPGISVVSSMGLMDIPGYQGPHGSLLAFGDAAVNVDPTDVELADIAITTSETVRTLMGWDTKCALLSFSTDGSAEHTLADKVKRAVTIANGKRPDLAIDGEFQLDAAIVPAIAAKKVRRESAVAGRADIIIYPELNAGNIGVKLVQQFAHADAYGPMLQGFAKPVSDCSRSAPVSELVGNIMMLAVCAQNRG